MNIKCPKREFDCRFFARLVNRGQGFSASFFFDGDYSIGGLLCNLASAAIILIKYHEIRSISFRPIVFVPPELWPRARQPANEGLRDKIDHHTQ